VLQPPSFPVCSNTSLHSSHSLLLHTHDATRRASLQCTAPVAIGARSCATRLCCTAPASVWCCSTAASTAPAPAESEALGTPRANRSMWPLSPRHVASPHLIPSPHTSPESGRIRTVEHACEARTDLRCVVCWVCVVRSRCVALQQNCGARHQSGRSVRHSGGGALRSVPNGQGPGKAAHAALMAVACVVVRCRSQGRLCGGGEPVRQPRASDDSHFAHDFGPTDRTARPTPALFCQVRAPLPFFFLSLLCLMCDV
jgi:hypothetical protein